MSNIDAVYAERNAVVLAFAKLARASGWEVGWSRDDREPDWPVLMIATPAGQVSWHFQRCDAEANPFPDFSGKWDGHTNEQKYARLEAL